MWKEKIDSAGRFLEASQFSQVARISPGGLARFFGIEYSIANCKTSCKWRAATFPDSSIGRASGC